MTKDQERVVEEIRVVASGHWEVKEFEVRDFHEENPIYKNVSVAVFFGTDCKHPRRAVHLFVGPRGGIRYPVQTGKKQICKKFDWDFMQVMEDQEKGWEKYCKARFRR